MAFKAGDKVKIVSISERGNYQSHCVMMNDLRMRYYKSMLGKTSIINGDTTDEPPMYILKEKDDTGPLCLFENNLELIKEEESKMKFKIGDKVKTARKCGSEGGWKYHGNMPLDIIGEVVKIDNPGSYIVVDIGSRGVNAYHPDELDLIPDEPKVSEVVPFLKSIEEVQSFVKESKEQLNVICGINAKHDELLSKLEGNKNVTDGILQAHRDQLSIINRYLESLVKPSTTSIFDSLNSPEDAVAFLVSEWAKCTNPKVKNEHSSANMITDGGSSNIQFRFSKR